MYAIEYYSAMKMNKVLIHDTTWMNLKNMLRMEEIGHKRSHVLMILFI